MKKAKGLLILSFFLSVITMGLLSSIADDEVEQNKTFATQEDFREAVKEEVVKQMKRIGQGELIGLSKELLDKEEKLRIREIKISKREEQLEINKRDFEKKMKEFTQRQQDFLGCLEDQDQEIDNRINHMVDVVGGMRPQSAADVLSVQEPDISIQILGMLDPERVSKIFNLMDKEVSARLQKQYMNMKK